MSDVDEPVDPRAHKSLLQAISSLGKVAHIRKTTRSEPKLHQDEFQLVKSKTEATSTTYVPKTRAAVGVNDIVQILKATENHITAGKKLRNIRNSKKVLPKPLEKPEAERIKRTIGYENVKNKLTRWDAVVAKNRSAETQVFPLHAETIYVNTSAKAKPLELSVKSNLKNEMQEAEAKLKALKRQSKGDMTDEKEEERRERELVRKKLTREELITRHKELAYLKMRESQKSAKARLQKKIKSKKYHKLLKRQKLHDQIKEFELLQKTNPDAALEKLNELEKNRVLERASLRHKNTGTWAKNLQVRAKYDKDVRKDLAEQLQISRQLTEKKEDESSEEEDMNAIKKETKQDENVVNDPFNPWTKANNSKSDNNTEENTEEPNWRKYWSVRNDNQKMLDEYKRALIETMTMDLKSEDEGDENEKEIKDNDEASLVKVQSVLTKKSNKQAQKLVKLKKPKQKTITKSEKKQINKKALKVEFENGWLVEDLSEEIKTKTNARNIDDIFDEQEDKIRNKLKNKLELLVKAGDRLKKPNNKQSKKFKEKNELKNLQDLSFKNQRIRPDIDEELNYDGEEKIQKPNDTLNNPLNSTKTTSNSKAATAVADATETENDIIDPAKLATVKLKNNLSSYDMMNDEITEDVAIDDDIDMDMNQQMTISQAFEDDDIVADFTKDKAKDAEIKNAEIDLTLPGWGSWAGAGIEKNANNQRNKRLVLKLATEEKRRDDNKDQVYINEESAKQLRAHLVSDVPFPFTSLQDYEASIRAPIGRNYVPETAFRMLTRPAVITRKGQIIEPMNESELIKPPRRLNATVDRRIATLNQQKQRKPF